MIDRLEPPRDPERSLLDAGIEPRPWAVGPGTHFAAHAHERPKRLFVVRGSIAFNGEWLRAPAGIRIPAGFEHSADAGDDGVECVEGFE